MRRRKVRGDGGLRDPFWMLRQHEHPVVTSLRALDGLVEPTPEP